MSNDIKIIDYIPSDGIVCARCIYYEICPADYACPSIDRQLEYEFSEEYEE